MPNGHGGARTPANPAQVSGPGVFSKRTDGKQPIMDLPNAGYGQNAQFRQDQSGAPLPQQPPPGAAPGGPPTGLPPGPGGPGGDPGQPPMPLTGGSLLPDQPVTHGADSGPGPDSSSLKLPNPVQSQHASALSLVQSLASQPSASPAMRFLASSLSQGY